jgi:hypothetical protein
VAQGSIVKRRDHLWIPLAFTLTLFAPRPNFFRVVLSFRYQASSITRRRGHRWQSATMRSKKLAVSIVMITSSAARIAVARRVLQSARRTRRCPPT